MNTSRSTPPDPAATPTLRLAADEAGLAAAAALLARGATVAFPTETVYGLGADATDARAVAAIYAAKARPAFNPLIAHVPDLAAARAEGVFDARAEALARRYWPGPLTLVVPRAGTGRVCDLARAGLDTIALRVPAHTVARALLERVGRPVAAPSANRSGRVSPTRAGHVAADLDGRVAAILDGGATTIGLESTVLACLPGEPARLLRPGGLAREAIAACLGEALADAVIGEAPVAPGLLASHYAPRAALRLDADSLRPGEAGLLFGQGSLGDPPPTAPTLDLSPRHDLTEAAANLFAHLRELDATGAACIAVASIPGRGRGEAINDRLRRAAAPRNR